MSYASKYGFCATCRPLLRRNSLLHRKSVLHKHCRRLRALLAKDCVTYSEIGARLGITRERVRQLADAMGVPHIGRMRQTSCTTNKRMVAFRSLPFVQKLASHRLRVEPIETLAHKPSRVTFSVDGRRVSLSRACPHGGSSRGPYLNIYKPQRRRADIYVWTLPDNDFLILPKQMVTFHVSTSFSMQKPFPGGKGYAKHRNHYWRYVNAWQVFRGKLSRNFA